MSQEKWFQRFLCQFCQLCLLLVGEHLTFLRAAILEGVLCGLRDCAALLAFKGATQCRRNDRSSRAHRQGPQRRARRLGRGVGALPWRHRVVWHGALRSIPVAQSLVPEGFTIRAQIIWAKERLVIGRGDYHWQHEPCWYAVRTKGNWTGDRKQTTLWTIPSGGQDTETIHGTQKPVECMRRPMLNNSSPGQAVYEPFLGSGTTLIAAQSCGRVCLAIELDPLYVDVAIKRWQAFTGEEATLL